MAALRRCRSVSWCGGKFSVSKVRGWDAWLNLTTRGSVLQLRCLSSSKETEKEYDVVVVGGGIVGVATARELLRRHPSLKFAILDKEKKLAPHQSGHNSGVIHAGIYYAPGSLKAKLCVRGLELSYKYLDEHGVPYKKCGKLIVAVTPEEIPRLDALQERGLQNGVKDLQRLDAEGIKKVEPNCTGLQALWSPHTGIVDWAEVTRSYGQDFAKLGGEILLNFTVKALEIASESQRKENAGLTHPVRILGQTETSWLPCLDAIQSPRSFPFGESTCS